jgi:quercetin dioxygenase-like cupin family protein
VTSALRVVTTIAVMAACAIFPAHVGAGDSAPHPILAQDLHWMRPPGNADVQGAWVVGAEDKPGPYLFRVRLAAGGRVAPHTHPDERASTVLAGTLYVGFGSVFDATKLVAVPTGAVYVAPANVAHYVFAKDGAVEYQEAGVGPTKTVPVQ